MDPIELSQLSEQKNEQKNEQNEKENEQIPYCVIIKKPAHIHEIDIYWHNKIGTVYTINIDNVSNVSKCWYSKTGKQVHITRRNCCFSKHPKVVRKIKLENEWLEQVEHIKKIKC